MAAPTSVLLVLPLAVLASPLVAEAVDGQENFTAVVADIRGVVRVFRADGSGPFLGTLGRRLRVGDTVETAADSSATIYLSGGQLVELLAGSRIRITRDLATETEKQERHLGKLSARSLQVLERGVWVLSDPEGSLLIGGLRDGEKKSRGSGVVLLSPRSELVTDHLPRFYWSGSPDPVRVIVEHEGEVLWRSGPTEASFLRYSADAPPLAPGESYSWWIESSAGDRLTQPELFGIPSADVSQALTEFEEMMRDLEQSGDFDHASDFLRCAYYKELDAWSEMLDVAARLSRDDDTAEFAAGAMARISRHMNLRSGELKLLRERRELSGFH